MDKTKSKWWSLIALALSGLVVGLDLTILNVALPTLASALHASTSDLQWFANAYNLTVAALLLPAGLLGDRFGRKKLLVAALILFAGASLACAYAGSVGALIGARALLGLAAAFVVPLSFAIIPVLFPSADDRRKAMGVVIATNAIGAPLGPIVGGLLLNHFWWGSVFFVNVPVIILATIAAIFFMPDSRSKKAHPLDLPGMLTSSLGLAGVTYGFIEAGAKSWTNGQALASMMVGALLLAIFAIREYRTNKRAPEETFIDISLFRSPSFTWGTILTTIVTFAMFGLLFTIPQFLQAIMGTDALGTGLRLIPLIIGLMVGSRISQRIAKSAGNKKAVAIGYIFVTGGMLLGAQTHVTSSFGFIALWTSIVGLGLGFVLPTAAGAAISALSAERSGVGSALLQAVRQVGGTIGVAILGTILGSSYRNSLNLDHLPTSVAAVAQKGVASGVAVAHKLHSTELLNSVQTSFAHATDIMLLVCAGIAVLGLALTLIFLPSVAHEASEEAIGEKV
jgi:DHA2 family multidrug resistance protein-like MFS transporter